MTTHDEPDRVEIVAYCTTPTCKWQRIYTPATPDSIRRAARDIWDHDGDQHHPERTGLRLLNPCPGPLRRNHRPPTARAA